MTSQSDNMLNSVQFTPYEVETVLKSLKTGKASGPDSINNRILKELSQPLSYPLCDLSNYSIATGKVPAIWKQANITPIFKKNDVSDLTNYRPISLLSSIGKVLEKLVHKRIFNFFRDNQVITTLQSVFVPGDSTVNQLVDIYNTFCKALDEGKEVRAIFCDISKAFDRVCHKGLLFKLESVGIGGSLLNWFTDYLDNRVQRDFNTRNKVLTAKLLRQGYRYHKLRKAFSKFYRRHFDIVSKYNVGLKTLLLQGLSEPEFYGDLVYKFRKIIGKIDFPYHFKKIIVRYKKIGYNINVMRQTACLVVNPIKVNSFAYLFNCTTVGRTSD